MLSEGADVCISQNRRCKRDMVLQSQIRSPFGQQVEMNPATAQATACDSYELP